MKKGVREHAKKFRGRPKAKSSGATRKRAVNVSIDEKILADAKAMGINLSQLLESELRARTQRERDRRFQEEHRAAIESHNRFIDDNGIWSEKYRSW